MAPARKASQRRVAAHTTTSASTRRKSSSAPITRSAATKKAAASSSKGTSSATASARTSAKASGGAGGRPQAKKAAAAKSTAASRKNPKVPSRGGRDALVEAVLAELSVKGPANIYPNDISTSLGLSKSLVNFHFGDRDGLVAEAMATGYERYVDHLWDRAQAAGDDAVARLLAWIDAQFEWTIANVGLAAALNFPYEAAALDGVANPVISDRLAVTGRRNLGNLAILIRDAIVQLQGSKAVVDQVRLYMDVGVIGWMTLGMSVFTAGRHLPTKDLAERSYTEQAKQHLHQTVIAMLKR